MDKKQVLLCGEVGFVETAQDFFSNSEKFTVMIAEDGEAFLAMLEEKPDLAIVDIDLPKRRGDVCCRAARRAGLSPATLLALAVSTDRRRDIGRCIDAGCDIILPKPLRHERLAEVATRFLFKGRHIPHRFPVRLKVRYGKHPCQLTETYSVNLTTMGIFLEAEKVESMGTPLHLVFNLPHDGTVIECIGRVAWLNRPLRTESLLPFGMGLEFVEMDNRQVNDIREFLYSLAAT